MFLGQITRNSPKHRIQFSISWDATIRSGVAFGILLSHQLFGIPYFWNCHVTVLLFLCTHTGERDRRERESQSREIRAFWAMTKLTSALFDRCDGRATMTSSVIGIVGQTDRNQNDSWSLFPCLGVVANIVPVSWLICISFGFNNRLLYKLLYPLRCYVGPFRGKFLARCVVCDGLSLDDDVRRGVWLLLFQRNRLTNVQCKSPKTKGVWMESHLLGQRESWIATAACRVVCVC